MAEYCARVYSKDLQHWAQNDQGTDTEQFPMDQVFLYLYVTKFEIFDHTFRRKVIIYNLKCYWNNQIDNTKMMKENTLLKCE